MAYPRYPMIYSVKTVYQMITTGPQAGLADGRWVPARPLGFASLWQRFRCAWLVFTGKADALTWDGQP